MACKVSLFLKTQRQEIDGRFKLDMTGPVPALSCPPGTITYFTAEGEVSAAFKAQKCQPPAVLEPGARRTTLGENLYVVCSFWEIVTRNSRFASSPDSKKFPSKPPSVISAMPL